MDLPWEKKKVSLGVKLNQVGEEKKIKINHSSDEDPQSFLQECFNLGIDYFDVSPSYAHAEEYLGKFLVSLDSLQVQKVFVATKVGEHWNSEDDSRYVDHSLTAMKLSLDHSLEKLGKIDLLQLHRPNPNVMRSSEFGEIVDYARSKGIKKWGVCVDDLETGRLACQLDIFSVIRLTYNYTDQTYSEIIDLAMENNKSIVINHPLNMGYLLTEFSDQMSKEEKLVTAFKFILNKKFKGVILTDIKNIKELEENLAAFKRVS